MLLQFSSGISSHLVLLQKREDKAVFAGVFRPFNLVYISLLQKWMRLEAFKVSGTQLLVPGWAHNQPSQPCQCTKLPTGTPYCHRPHRASPYFYLKLVWLLCPPVSQTEEVWGVLRVRRVKQQGQQGCSLMEGCSGAGGTEFTLCVASDGRLGLLKPALYHKTCFQERAVLWWISILSEHLLTSFTSWYVWCRATVAGSWWPPRAGSRHL